MGNIQTKHVKVGTGGKNPMSFTPGNRTCKINSITLDRPPFAKSGEVMYNIMMNLETKPIGNGFEGFFIDKDNESKGRYDGQVGRVKSSAFAYKDSEYKGKTFVMTDEILKFIKTISIAIGDPDWLDKADNKYKTIEKLVEGFNSDAPFKDVYLDWCIGGTQDTNEAGYPVYYMNLAKYESGYKQVAPEGDAHVIPFNKELHIYVKNGQTAPVKEFSSEETHTFESQDDDDDSVFDV